MTEQPSGRLYTAVTKYWPRIAVGLVALVGVAGWIIEGLTADTGIEFYLMAWGATTGGLWFMFEKAEKSLGDESRKGVVAWLGTTDIRTVIESIPVRFVSLFDRIFGEKKAKLLVRARSCEKAGIGFTLHSDIFVTDPDPLHMIEMAVTRRTWKEPDYALAPEEAISVESAIRALTSEAAWQLGSEKRWAAWNPASLRMQ